MLNLIIIGVVIVIVIWLILGKSVRENFHIPEHGEGYFSSPLNTLYYYYWPYSQLYAMPYSYGGMTKYDSYPYRSSRYFPEWYYREVGYLNQFNDRTIKENKETGKNLTYDEIHATYMQDRSPSKSLYGLEEDDSHINQKKTATDRNPYRFSLY